MDEKEYLLTESVLQPRRKAEFSVDDVRCDANKHDADADADVDDDGDGESIFLLLQTGVLLMFRIVRPENRSYHDGVSTSTDRDPRLLTGFYTLGPLWPRPQDPCSVP